MGVLTDGQVRQDSDFLSLRRQFIVAGKGNGHFVSDAIHIHHHLRGQQLGQPAMEKGYHGCFVPYLAKRNNKKGAAQFPARRLWIRQY
jgi:hypothetical protein